MRHFKIPLCQNFVRNDEKTTGQKKKTKKEIGQKMGYDRCPYLSFFDRRKKLV
jgi:hypothetical protein